MAVDDLEPPAYAGVDEQLRPVQPETPPRDAFSIQRAEVTDGIELAYLREGVGGYPLLLR